MKQNIGQMIWEKYKAYWLGRTVARSGVDSCGATIRTPDLRLPLNAPEDDLEHEALVTWLLQLILMFYPEILPDELKVRLLRLALVHDVVENEDGDKNDDGTMDPQEKKKYEAKQMEKFVSGLPEPERDQLLHDFLMLEDAKLWTADQVTVLHPLTRMVQIMFMADKLTAVLSAMCFEGAGSPGDLRKKALNGSTVSERDLYYTALTGSTLISDVWSAHFIDYTKWFGDFPIFFNVWKEAYLDVRGTSELPEWRKVILKNKWERIYQPIAA